MMFHLYGNYRHKWKTTITNRIPLINIDVELIGQLEESIDDEWDEWNSAIWRLVAQGFSHTPCDWLQHYKRGCSISGIVIWTYMEFPKDLHVLIQIVLDHKNILLVLKKPSLYGCRTIRADVVYPSKWIFDQLGIYAPACIKSEIARVEKINSHVGL